MPPFGAQFKAQVGSQTAATALAGFSSTETTGAGASGMTAPAATGAQEHVIARGDNFWKLAEKFYGNGEKWHVLQDANPDYKPRFLPSART